MQRRDMAKVLLVSAAGAAALSERSEAQSCTAPCFATTAAEIAAGVTPTNTAYSANGPIDVRRYGYAPDNNPASATANTTALNKAILVAGTTVGGETGATVLLPTGVGYISSTIILPNRVRVQGQNCSGSMIKATTTFSSPTQPYMFWANNGTISMFDSILQDLFIDCNDVAGLGGILTDAWQENSGMRSVGLMKFRTYGLRFRNVGAGGQSTCEIQQCQFFGSTLGATAGIKVDQISSVGGFLVHVRDSTIASANANGIVRGIDVDNDSLLLQNVHFEGCTDCVYVNGYGTHTYQNVSGCGGSNATPTLVHAAATFAGRLTMTGCIRNGATYFLVNDASGETYSSPDLAMYVYPDIKAKNTAKAWCFFNGATAGTNPPTAGSNVTSVQRISTGRYRVNLTNYTTNGSIAMFVSTNQGAQGANNWCQAVNVAYFLVNLDVAGVPTDASEVRVVAFAL
jgi:hypothetical protein